MATEKWENTIQNCLAFYHQGRFREALPLAEKALNLALQEFGTKHPNTGGSLFQLARLHYALGRYEKAQRFYQRTLAVVELVLGSDHPNAAACLSGLAELYRQWGRYKEAEPLFLRALAIQEGTLGPEHPDVADTLGNLAGLYYQQGRYLEAEQRYQRALGILELTLPHNHPDIAACLNNLAVLYRALSRYAEAEQLYRRALEIIEGVRGPEHPHTAVSLNNLARLYHLQNRYAEAEPLYWRALEIGRQVLGPDHPNVALNFNNLAVLYYEQGRYAEAEPLHQQALKARERRLGPDHPEVAASLNNLANLYDKQARYAKAEPLFQRALRILERALGPDHPNVAASLNNLAGLYCTLRRYAEAEPLYRRALEIAEQALGPDHPDVAVSLRSLAVLYCIQGRYQDALAYARRVTGIYRQRTTDVGDPQLDAAINEQKTNRAGFIWHLSGIAGLLNKEPEQDILLIAEAFEVMQLFQASETAVTVMQMAARFATGDDHLARLVRERQDTAAGLRALDARLLESVSKAPQMRHPEAEAALRAERAALAARLGELGDKLRKDFPKYAELMALQPLPLSEAQALLAPDEALMLYSFFTPDQSYLLAIRRERAGLYRVQVPLDVLTTAVERLRTHLDLGGIRDLSELRERLPTIGLETLPYGLYLALVAPAEALLAGVRHLLLVPDGPLESLPLGILLTEPPAGRLTAFDELRRLSWLIRRYAMTVLPSVAALKALRRTAHASRAPKPFLGIGDPLLGDVEAELPDTAEELDWLCFYLKGSPEDLWLREQATVSRVRTADLRAYRVLAFATHTLVRDAHEGHHEPALVLTPRAVGRDEDDGLLRASDIAKLNLDAEWVLLPCCYTAASDGTPGAEGLSGLAKAFLYAGARTLLVSHWAVGSQAAKLLTTGMISELDEHPEIGRAEALRRAMLDLIDGPPNPDPEESAGSAYLAHPAFWAPLIVVGEGGRWPPAGDETGGGADQRPSYGLPR